jgi:hypothetical protein
MIRPRCGLALLAALVLVLGACSTSGSKQLNIAKAKKEITKLADGVYSREATVGRVVCPNSVEVKRDLIVFCTVDIDGVPLRVSLKQTDTKGNVRIDQTQSVIFTSKLETFVSSYGQTHGTPVRAVRCGNAKVITAAPGKVLTCAVDFPGGRHGQAKIVVNDTTGKVGLTALKVTG